MRSGDARNNKDLKQWWFGNKSFGEGMKFYVIFLLALGTVSSSFADTAQPIPKEDLPNYIQAISDADIDGLRCENFEKSLITDNDTKWRENRMFYATPYQKYLRKIDSGIFSTSLQPVLIFTAHPNGPNERYVYEVTTNSDFTSIKRVRVDHDFYIPVNKGSLLEPKYERAWVNFGWGQCHK